MRVAEYEMIFLAPDNKDNCHYGLDYPWRCKNPGLFHFKVVNDRNIVVLEYASICESHLLQTVISYIMGH